MAEAPAPTEQLRLHDVVTIPVMPMTADEAKIIGTAVGGAKAVIFLAFATGTTPDVLNPVIKECTKKDIPVFLLSTNYARDTGIQKVTYGPQLEAVEAGATPLKDINVNAVSVLANEVQTAINNGQTGDELRKAMVAKFGTPTVPPPQH